MRIDLDKSDMIDPRLFVPKSLTARSGAQLESLETPSGGSRCNQPRWNKLKLHRHTCEYTATDTLNALLYSSLSTWIGSTLVARHAGSTLAASATAISASVTAPNVSGSLARIP